MLLLVWIHLDTPSSIVTQTLSVSIALAFCSAGASTEDYNIQDLAEGTEYSITVILTRDDGATGEDTTTATTADIGKLQVQS